MPMYYQDKIRPLKEVFGTERIAVEEGFLIVDDRRFPVVDDVIIALEPAKWPRALRERLSEGVTSAASPAVGFAEDIQFTFGEER